MCSACCIAGVCFTGRVCSVIDMFAVEGICFIFGGCSERNVSYLVVHFGLYVKYAKEHVVSTT